MVTLDGGTLKVNSAAVEVEGKFNYLAGTLHLTDPGGYTVGANGGAIDQLLGGTSVGLAQDKYLIVEEALTLPASTTLTSVGGGVAADTISNDGLFVHVANLLISYAGGDGNDVTLLSALPGDFDIDGDVDGHDFLKLQRGESPNPVSASDLADWEANYGTNAPLSATSPTLPEPATWIMLLIGMATKLTGGRTLVSKLNCACDTSSNHRIRHGLAAPQVMPLLGVGSVSELNDGRVFDLPLKTKAFSDAIHENSETVS